MKKDLYNRVKFVEGENFVTIEETKRLSEAELLKLTEFLLADPQVQSVDHLTLLIDSECSETVDRYLVNHHFTLLEEQVFVRCDLSSMRRPHQPFTLKSLRHVSHQRFKEVWERSMKNSLNASSYLNMDEQMKSVEKELGPTYVDTCNIAFEGDEAIGVVMPHIEPGTKKEGRIFYFGLVQEARGKGKSSSLYKQGLYILKERFGADYSVGATSVNNEPMLKVFENNQCEVKERVKVYKRMNGGD